MKGEFTSIAWSYAHMAVPSWISDLALPYILDLPRWLVVSLFALGELRAKRKTGRSDMRRTPI